MSECLQRGLEGALNARHVHLCAFQIDLVGFDLNPGFERLKYQLIHCFQVILLRDHNPVKRYHVEVSQICCTHPGPADHVLQDRFLLQLVGLGNEQILLRGI